MPIPLPQSFYHCEPLSLAVALLGKVLVTPVVAGRIVETEAYGGADDSASHGYRGCTARNEVMFGAAGHLYVYFTYGMHYCANVVCGDERQCAAVLLRALEPLSGLVVMRRRRRISNPKLKSDRELLNGPAKLSQALGIGRAQNGIALYRKVKSAPRIYIYDDGSPPPDKPACSARIGIVEDVILPWRFYVSDSLYVSR